MRVRNALALTVAAGVATIALAASSAEPSVQGDAGRVDAHTTKGLTTRPYSPYAGRAYPPRPLFGDTHLHTAISLDAIAAGAKVGPDVAYRYARGEEVTTSSGQQAKLSRPLDFLVVSDHAEAFGAMTGVVKGDPALMADPKLKSWNQMIAAGGEEGLKAAWEIIGLNAKNQLPKAMTSPTIVRGVWDRNIKVADQFNEPGRFTALIGYEWTSMPAGDNLHRVVVLRDGADRAAQTLPFGSNDSENVEDLWQTLAAYEQRTGGQALAIPHNGNISGGKMFALADFMGNPLTRKYAEQRARWEPLYEVTQQKGDGESHPKLSPGDDFAGYETWDKLNLGGDRLHQDAFLEGEYARAALKNGLMLEQKLGANPFKFGMIGSTDSHSGISAVEEDNFFGKGVPYEPNPTRAEHVFQKKDDVVVHVWELASSGYAAVWATENTREAIFDAMKRRETYATTGTRMTVRFFAGWEFGAADALHRRPAEVGYAKGVPMGADLPAQAKGAAKGAAPTFLVAAAKDPIGANLDRIQVVKGWVDAKGAVQEKVYDVVWSGDRKPGADGKLPPVGDTVDVANATWTNTIGAPELITVWTDPAFDAKQRAFYYARVIEIPTPRWTAYDARFFGTKMPPEVRMKTQERAYTSPIWYTPR